MYNHFSYILIYANSLTCIPISLYLHKCKLLHMYIKPHMNKHSPYIFISANSHMYNHSPYILISTNSHTYNHSPSIFISANYLICIAILLTSSQGQILLYVYPFSLLFPKCKLSHTYTLSPYIFNSANSIICITILLTIS